MIPASDTNTAMPVAPPDSCCVVLPDVPAWGKACAGTGVAVTATGLTSLNGVNVGVGNGVSVASAVKVGVCVGLGVCVAFGVLVDVGVSVAS